MLVVYVMNKTGGKVSDYEYEVFVNRSMIARGGVRRHRRSAGWRALLRRVAGSPAKSRRAAGDRVRDLLSLTSSRLAADAERGAARPPRLAEGPEGAGAEEREF